MKQNTRGNVDGYMELDCIPLYFMWREKLYMKILIAIDSLKGSLSSMEAGNAIAEGIKRVNKQAEIVVRPLADGGEGTTEVLVQSMGGQYESICVTGPLGEKVNCVYGVIEESKTAVIEMSRRQGSRWYHLIRRIHCIQQLMALVK